jgi:hypothetical protein
MGIIGGWVGKVSKVEKKRNWVEGEEKIKFQEKKIKIKGKKIGKGAGRK